MSKPPSNRLIQGDCLTELKKLPDGCVDLAFADPPFNIGYHYDQYDDNLPSDEYEQWCEEWMTEVVRVLKDDGTFWLAIGDEYAAELKVLLKRSLGMHCRSWVVWYYTFGVNCSHKFSRSHAHLLYFTKHPTEFTFNADDPSVRVPSARQLVYNDKRANPKGRLPDDTWIIPPILRDHEGWVLRPQDVPESFQSSEDTWYVPRVAGTFKERKGWHGCQMPEQILARIIRSCSHEDDLVLDPFAGSGTTLAVAKKLGRKYLGFEISEDYANWAGERLDHIRVGDLLDGAENPLRSAPATNDRSRSRDNKKLF